MFFSCRSFLLATFVTVSFLVPATVVWSAASSSSSSGGATTPLPRDVTARPESLARTTALAVEFFAPLLADAKTDTEQASLLHQRGVLYLRSHRKRKAIADFNEAIRLLPKNNEERFEVLLHRACAYLLLPTPDAAAALTDITICLTNDPTNAEALIVRAEVYRIQGRKELSAADIAHAAVLAPKGDTTIRTLIENAQDATR